MIMLTKIGGVIRTLVRTWWRWLLIALVGELIIPNLKVSSPTMFHGFDWRTGKHHTPPQATWTYRKTYTKRQRIYNGVAAAIPLVLLILCIVLMVGVL